MVGGGSGAAIGSPLEPVTSAFAAKLMLSRPIASGALARNEGSLSTAVINAPGSALTNLRREGSKAKSSSPLRSALSVLRETCSVNSSPAGMLVGASRVIFAAEGCAPNGVDAADVLPDVWTAVLCR